MRKIGVACILALSLVAFAYTQGGAEYSQPAGLSDLGDGEVNVYLPIVSRYYPDWEIITQMDFEGAFPDDWYLMGSTAYQWAPRECVAAGGTFSGWAVGGGTSGSGLECGSVYPNNVVNWLAYGPFSLVNATAANLTFDSYVNILLGQNDRFCWMASFDGVDFAGTCAASNHDYWYSRNFNLASIPYKGSALGRSSVWVAFYFTSDATGAAENGAFVDNVVLRKCMTGGCSPLGSGMISMESGARIEDISFEQSMTVKP